MISCGITKHLVYCLVSIILSAFINGINLSVRESALISIFNFTSRVQWMRVLEESQGPEPGSKDIYNSEKYQNEKMQKFLVLWISTYFFAQIIGAVLSGYSADRFGRKLSLLWNNSLVFLAIFFICFSARTGSYELVIFGQILIGINSGMNTCLAPIYLTEVSPIRTRGIFGSTYIVATSLASIITYTIIEAFKLENWIYMFSSLLVPSILMIAVLNECPESPKFSFIIKGDQMRAQNALQKLRENSEISEELYEMKVELQTIERNQRFRLKYIFRDYKIINGLFISLVVIMSKHMTGITAVNFFAEAIYKSVGFSANTSYYFAITSLIIGFITSLISMFLVEKMGRRTILLIGLLGMFCALVFLTFCLALKESLQFLSYLTIITLILFLIFYSCGPSFIPFFYFTELFRTDSRSICASISVVVLNSIPFVNSLPFFSLQIMFDGYVFALFAIITLIFWIIIYKKLPETKGKTIEEIIFEL